MGLLELPNEVLESVLQDSLRPSLAVDEYNVQARRFLLFRVCKVFKQLLQGPVENKLIVRYAGAGAMLLSSVRTDPARAQLVTELHLELIDPRKISAGRDIERMRSEMRSDAATMSELLQHFPNLQMLNITTACKNDVSRCPPLTNDEHYESSGFEEEIDDFVDDTLPLDAFLLAFSRLPSMRDIKHFKIWADLFDSNGAMLLEGATWHSVSAFLDALVNVEQIDFLLPSFAYYRIAEEPAVSHPRLQRIETTLEIVIPRLLSGGLPEQKIDVSLKPRAHLGDGRTDQLLLSAAEKIETVALLLYKWSHWDSTAQWQLVSQGGPASISARCASLTDVEYCRQYFERLTNLRELTLGCLGFPDESMGDDERAFHREVDVHVEVLVKLVQEGCFDNLAKLNVTFEEGYEQTEALRAICLRKGIQLNEEYVF